RAEAAGERERLQRQLVIGLDEGEDHATPSRRRTSRTAGAASGPRPRISAFLPWPSGTTSRSFSSRGAGRAGRLSATGLRPARSLAGTDGYRGRLSPSSTVRTAGVGTR